MRSAAPPCGSNAAIVRTRRCGALLPRVARVCSASRTGRAPDSASARPWSRCDRRGGWRSYSACSGSCIPSDSGEGVLAGRQVMMPISASHSFDILDHDASTPSRSNAMALMARSTSRSASSCAARSDAAPCGESGRSRFNGTLRPELASSAGCARRSISALIAGTIVDRSPITRSRRRPLSATRIGVDGEDPLRRLQPTMCWIAPLIRTRCTVGCDAQAGLADLVGVGRQPRLVTTRDPRRRRREGSPAPRASRSHRGADARPRDDDLGVRERDPGRRLRSR